MTKQKYNLEKIIAGYKNVYSKNPNITSENFPKPEKVETENWKLIKMGRSFSSQEALDKIKSEGCRPANIYELLLWAKDNQEKSQWVIGFGSEWKDSDGRHRVPYVDAYGGGDFHFLIGYFEKPWDVDSCLLCFCDSPLTPLGLLNERVERLEKLVESIKTLFNVLIEK